MLDASGSNSRRSNLETVDRLILTHWYSVLFENLDCCDSRVIPALNLVSMYDKVVIRSRGGYYFELNNLFLALLRNIGFDAWAVSSCIIRGKDLVPLTLYRETSLTWMVRTTTVTSATGLSCPAPCPPDGSTTPSARGSSSKWRRTMVVR